MKELKALFKKNVYIEVKPERIEQINKPQIPDGMWVKCPNCGKILYRGDLENNLKICFSCEGHFRISAKERIKQVVDEGTFKELFSNITSTNPLDFPGYEEKLHVSRQKLNINEAVVTGEGKIEGYNTVICVMDSNFMMGSMGSAVGEKLTRAIEYSTKKRFPIIIFTCSGGASFGMLGDIILAEPKTLIGFAGRRVIQQTIGEELPEDFQRAEFLLEKGFVDKIVHRKEMKKTLGKLLELHSI